MPVRDLLSAASGAGGPSDPYFYDVSLLLNGDGTNGAQNNTFLDSSSNAYTITRNGNTTQGSFSPYGTLWSNYVSGTYSTVNTGPYLKGGTSVSLSTGNFTYEGWFNFSSPSSSNYLFNIGDDVTSGGMTFYNTSATNIRIYGNNTTLTNFTISALNPNVWYHFAFVRNSGVITFYLNGVSQGTYSSSLSLSGNPYVFAEYNGGGYYGAFSGYASNVRLTNTAVYTTAFTPSATPLTAISGTQFLTCQSNRFIDNSSNNATITTGGSPSVQRFSPFNPTAPYSTATIGGSGYFDANGAYLQASANTAFELGSGDYTLECWLYLTANGNSNGSGLISKGSFNSLGNEVYTLQVNNSNIVQFYAFANVTSYLTPILASPSGLSLNTWYHIAVTRSGSTHTLWINGVSVNTSSTSYTITTGGPMNVGGTWYDPGASAREITGYMCDSRVVKGTAVYTTTFTPPTAPESAVSGTSLLLHYTNAGIPDLAMQNDLQTVGNAQVSTSVKKYGTGSLAFDGSGDWLRFSPNNNFYFGTGDFTVEFWLNTSVGNQAIVDQWLNSSGSYTTGQWQIGMDATTRYLSFYVATGASAYSSFTTSSAPASGQWVYVAFVRSSNVIKCYIDGTANANTLSFSGVVGVANSIASIGIQTNSSTSPFTGYIDDFRITNGYARYTTNFTPPTAALPTY